MPNYIHEEIISVSPAVTKTFHDAVSSSSSILKVLFGRAQGGEQMWPTQVERSFGGSNLMGMPVQLAHISSDSVSRDGQYTALSGTYPTADGTFDFATYNFTTARSNFQIGSRELRLMQQGDAKRFSDFELQAKAAANAIVKELTDDLNSATVDADGKLIGLSFAIDDGNTVGGIDQSSVAAWRSYVDSVGGALTTADVVSLISGATRDSVQYGWEQPDVLILSERTGSYLYSFLANAVNATVQAPVDRDFIKFGFKGFAFNGALATKNTAIASGLVLGVNSSTWAVATDGDWAPVAENPIRVPKANVTDYMYTWHGSVGCGDPARNGKLEAATG